MVTLESSEEISSAGAKVTNVAFQRLDHMGSEEIMGGQVGIPVSGEFQNHSPHKAATLWILQALE